MILCITGRPGSGKTEVSKILEKMGFHIIEMGSIIKSEMEKEGIPPTLKNIKEFMFNIRKLNGEEVVAQKVTEKILSEKGENIAIIGVRSLNELEYFKKNIKSISSIAVVSSQEKRFLRLNKRERSDDPKTLSEFTYRENNETKLGIDYVIENSDYIIDNSGTISELEKNVFMILKELEIHHDTTQ